MFCIFKMNPSLAGFLLGYMVVLCVVLLSGHMCSEILICIKSSLIQMLDTYILVYILEKNDLTYLILS